MRRFSPIPAKVHKPKRHVRMITSTPTGYKPRLRKLSYRREAEPVAHKRTFFVSKKKPAPKAPFKYKYKSDMHINGKFLLLLLVLIVLVAMFIMLFVYLIK